MSSTADIAQKHSQLKARGLDLGNPKGPILSLQYGGKLQKYEQGQIYWHAQVGCFEVHGGILTEYLRLGGYGKYPGTSRREFGFPIADEARTSDNEATVSEFEWGRIYWIAGAGAVPIFGKFLKEWKQHRYTQIRGAQVFLGYPNAEAIKLPNGSRVTYCGFGCVFTAGADDAAHACYYTGPLPGCPDLATPLKFSNEAFAIPIASEDAQWIREQRPALFADIWKDRLFLQSVKNPQTLVPLTASVATTPTTAPASPLSPGAAAMPVGTPVSPGAPAAAIGATPAVAVAGPAAPVSPGSTTVVKLRLSLALGATLADRTLYNIVMKLPNGRVVVMGLHAVYSKSEWSNFGVIHATDAHVSERCDQYHRRMIRLERQEALKHYNNFNEAFRHFILKANKLHDEGVIDAIALTGDLVDYQFEAGKDESKTGGNFAFFERMIRGAVTSPKGTTVEELRVPMFTTLGNHDYRRNPYLLRLQVDITGPKNPKIDNYMSHNLTEEECLRLVGERAWVSPDDAAAMVEVGKPDYYFSRINRPNRIGSGSMDPESSYIVRFGSKHRLVMMDSGHDIGMVDEAGAILTTIFGGTEDEEAFLSGSPNQRGVSELHLSLLETAMSQAGNDGIVMVGIHGPPLNVVGSDFAPFFRETMRSTDVKRDVLGFLHRRGDITANPPPGQLGPMPKGSDQWWTALEASANAKHRNWIDSINKRYFMHGTVEDLLDHDVSKGAANDLLKMCAGADIAGHHVSRPVDIVFCGHGHNAVEYRVKWDTVTTELQFFTDFYTENPTSYYKSRKPGWNLDQIVHISVNAGAPVNGVPTTNVQDTRWDGTEAFLQTPPYAGPLNSTPNPAEWWQQHRPLIVQTGGIGPRESSANDWQVPGNPKPGPTFQGFRVVEVKNDKIAAVRYQRLV